MRRREFLMTGTAAILVSTAGPLQAAAKPAVRVIRAPGCGCCLGWADHLKRAGYPVTVESRDDIAAIKVKWGVPDALTSCHTARVGGYVIEGHVPVREVDRLLAEKPKATGLAVPGMPIGSPGMEMGARVDPYRVYLFGEGPPKIYATYGQG